MSSGEQIRLGQVVGADEGMGTLMTMLFAIESIERSKDNASSKQREDPVADIRKLCNTLDEMLGQGGRKAKVSELGAGHREGRLGSDLGLILSGKYL